MLTVLRAIAALKTTTEMPEANRVLLDHGFRLNMIIEKAREVVGPQPQGEGHG